MGKKRKGPPVEEGLPGWMATFADMVTLLLCFFVLLLSFAEQSEQKFRDALGSIQGAFGVREVRARSDEMSLLNTSPHARERMQAITQQERTMVGVVMRLKTLLSELDEDVAGSGIQADRDGMLFSVDNSEIFEPGSARLKPGADDILEQIIKVLKEYRLNLVVRGHTDDTPIHTRAYPSNWELSAARAAVVLKRILELSDLQENRLKAVGYADTQPVAKNDTREGRLRNQRVEFYFHWPERYAW